MTKRTYIAGSKTSPRTDRAVVRRLRGTPSRWPLILGILLVALAIVLAVVTHR